MRWLLQGRLARRFVRQQDGAAAVEFALVAAPFLALTFAILETAMVFMTGQAQSANFSQAQFKTAVCARIYGLFDCANGLYVNVQTYASFSAVNTTPPVTNGQFNTTTTYNPGDVGNIVAVSLYYQWPIYVSMLGNNLANLNGGKRLLSATSVFRVEPYK